MAYGGLDAVCREYGPLRGARHTRGNLLDPNGESLESYSNHRKLFDINELAKMTPKPETIGMFMTGRKLRGKTAET